MLRPEWVEVEEILDKIMHRPLFGPWFKKQCLDHPFFFKRRNVWIVWWIWEFWMVFLRCLHGFCWQNVAVHTPWNKAKPIVVVVVTVVANKMAHSALSNTFKYNPATYKISRKNPLGTCMVSLMFLNSRVIGEVELMKTVCRNHRCKVGNYYILVTIQSSHLAQQGFINLNSSSNLVNLPCFKYHHQQEQCKKNFVSLDSNQIGNSTYPFI